MKKKLSRSGNSVAVILERGLLEQTGLDEGSEVEISTNGDVIVISPVRDSKRRRKLERALERINEKYAGVFRRLAE